jgi:protein-tyrosine phosphatase
MTTRVLVVCLGNICRSPTAEAVLRQVTGGMDVKIDSAGTSDWHVGDPPYGPAITAARARGYDLSPLRARQVSAEDFAAFDLILGMDGANVTTLETLRPAGSATPVQLFTAFGPDAADDVPDPYYTRDFEGALDLIEEAAEGLKAQLQSWDAKSPNSL